MNKETLNKISAQIIDASIVVHRELGPGLIESVYSKCLCKELGKRGLTVQSEVKIPVFYQGQALNQEFRIDILVESEIILELKTVEVLLPIHEAQLITYLKLADKRLGLLLNFNVPLMKQGIKRMVNNF